MSARGFELVTCSVWSETLRQRVLNGEVESDDACEQYAARIRELEDCVVEQRLTIVKGDARIRELEATIVRVRALRGHSVDPYSDRLHVGVRALNEALAPTTEGSDASGGES